MRRKRTVILAALLILALLLGGCAYFGRGVEIVVTPLPEEEAYVTKQGEAMQYVLNTKSRKFHYPECESVKDIQPGNREDYTGTREALIEDGYSPCKRCEP